MKCLSLKEHIKRSKQAVAANKAKGNCHAELLAGMYSKPARFIDEILQNTEDAYARKSGYHGHKSIKFELFHDRIEIWHNGKDFDEEDLKSITTFANTTKNNADKVNLIGKFGIGFKSVFAITDEPDIHSGGYHYKITDYEVLTKISKRNTNDNFATLFVMPFKAAERNKIYNIVRQGLSELNAYYLLFLTHINKIEIKFDSRKTSEFIEKQVIEIENEIQKVIVSSSIISRNNEKFLLLKKEKQGFALAFKIKTFNGKESVEPISNSKLFVYFPTLHETHLNFIVNATFTTTPTRENVPFNKLNAGENIILINEIAGFFGSKLLKLRDIGFLNIDFLNILPLKKPDVGSISGNENLVYKVFYDVVLKKLSEKKLLPTDSGRFDYARDLALATDSEICRLLQKRDLEELFSRKQWINSEVNKEGFEELRKYCVSSLNILEVGFEKFAFHLSLKPDFLKLKNDKWFIQFYSIISDKRHLWSKENKSQYYSLRTKAFIKLNDNSISEAFAQNGNPIVYLPGKQRSKYKIIKRAIAKKQKVYDFFKSFGLSEPDEFAELLENTLIKYNSETIEIHSRVYKSDIKKVLIFYSKSDVSQKEKLLSILKECYLFEANNPIANKTKFCKADELFVPSKKKIIEDRFFVSPRLTRMFIKEITENNLLKQLLQDLGVKYEENQKIADDKSKLSKEQILILNFIESKNISIENLQQIINKKVSNKIEITVDEVNVKVRDFEVLKQAETPLKVLSNIPEIGDLSNIVFPDFAPDNKKKELLKWSEDLVYKWLRENDLDESSVINKIEINEKGFSFEIKNKETSKYIAVVAKQIFEDDFQITKTMWKAAKKFNSSFWFYCIPNAGLSCTEIIRIHNPYKLWIEGKLSFNKLSFKF